MSALFAFLHHLAAFAFAGALIVEFVIIKDEINERTARRLIKADILYASAATVVLVLGFIRVYNFEKGAEYYWHSFPFIAKITLFAVVALLSFYPSAEFLKWRKQLRTGDPLTTRPEKLNKIRRIIHVELLGLALILLSAALIPRGYGYFG